MAAVFGGHKGGLISYEEYHPYGSTAWWAGSSGLVSQKRYRFTGMERDEETGLQCHGVRYYAVWLGRWVSVDPIGLGDGVNRFGYCHGGPTYRVDSSGLGDELPAVGYPGAGVDPAELAEAAKNNPDLPYLHGAPTTESVSELRRQGALPPAALLDSRDKHGNAVQVPALVIPKAYQLPLHAQVRIGKKWLQAKEGERVGDAAVALNEGHYGNSCAESVEHYVGILGYTRAREDATNLFTMHEPYPRPTSQNPATPERNRQILDRVDDELYHGKTTVVGVSLQPGDLGNWDQATDHWISVLGRGYEKSGAVYYWGVDATLRIPSRPQASVVRFYVDPETLSLYSLGKMHTPFGGLYKSNATNVKSITPK